ncbi:MAG TPA: hypothetical protein VG944_02680 [Fimbriimonas sp.]|nr:hypothetical protein [Fimbriimonas sp.]
MLLAVAAACLSVGCSGDSGPNDPSYTSAEIQKMRAAKVKPSDGNAPTATMGRKR